jgi:AsmA-like C-terminal region
VGPVRLDHGAPLSLQGYVWRQGYAFSVAGEGNVQHLLRSARTVGLPVPQPTADGSAKIDFQVAGNWTGFAPPKITGTAQLKSLRVELRGLSNPIEVASAAILLKAERTDVQAISASLAGGHWTGSLSLPRPCSALPTCPIAFNLQTDLLSTERIGKFVNSGSSKPWYRFLTPDKSSTPSLLSRFNASGRLVAAQLAIHGLIGSHAAANVNVQNGVLRISDLRAETLGGKHHGKWDVDFTAKPPRYSGEGTFEQVALEKLATSMHNNWITGTGDARYQVKSSGSTLPDLMDAASGTLQVDLSDGQFTTVILDRSPLRVDRFSGALALKSGEFTIDDGSLETPNATYMVSGTASLSGDLNFKLTRDKNSGLDVTGTLDEPHVLVVRAPSTEAVLKH